MSKVFIPNKSFHDFSEAERFGELVFLTNGAVKRLNVNQLYREIWEKMEGASPDDYLLPSSLAVLNAIAGSILGHKFGKVNFLLFAKDRYMVRSIVLPE